MGCKSKLKLIPKSTTVCEGESIKIESRKCCIEGLLKYQWFKLENDEPIKLKGETLSYLILNNTKASDTGFYILKVIDKYCKIFCAKSILIVNENPDVAVGSIPQESDSGDPVELIATIINGLEPFTYEWTPKDKVISPVGVNLSGRITVNTTSLPGDTIFEIKIVDKNGCKGSSTYEVKIE